MKTITIEVPEGKEAKWVNGVLTLVDEQPVNFKFKVGDRVTNIKYYGIYTVTRRFIEKGLPTYELRSIWGKSISSEIWLCLHVEPKDITERIKTFEDAMDWCKDNGKQGLYEQYADALNVGLQRAKDILAYLKLRIITAALNEGWEPTFEDDEEYRYYPLFNDNMEFLRSAKGIYVGGATPYKLYFKTAKLAEYAATQFKDIYMDFCHKGKE